MIPVQRFHPYAAVRHVCDIACTLPGSQVVLDARRRVLEAVRPGVPLARLHQLSVRLLSEGLQQLGVLPGLSADAIQAQHYRWGACWRRDVRGLCVVCGLWPYECMYLRFGNTAFVFSQLSVCEPS